MSKKLISLVFVLALAGMASAIQWVGPGAGEGPGNWAVASNWDLNRLPVASDATVVVQSLTAGHLGANVIVDSAVSGGVKPQFTIHTETVTIQDGGSISNDGSVELKGSATVTVTIDDGGVWDACQKLTQALGTFKLGTANSTAAIVDVYGTLNVKNTGTMTTTGSDLQVAFGTSANIGIGRLNIKDGGLVNVDAYSINSALVTSGIYAGQMRGKIKVDNGGILKIKGNVFATVTADIAAGKIVNGYGTAEDLIAWTGVEGFQTYTYVPEPATIALLGLGSLMLLRRKR
jgi:hypothetical protein